MEGKGLCCTVCNLIIWNSYARCVYLCLGAATFIDDEWQRRLFIHTPTRGLDGMTEHRRRTRARHSAEDRRIVTLLPKELLPL